MCFNGKRTRLQIFRGHHVTPFGSDSKPKPVEIISLLEKSLSVLSVDNVESMLDEAIRQLGEGLVVSSLAQLELWTRCAKVCGAACAVQSIFRLNEMRGNLLF